MPATIESVVEMAMELPVALREIVAHQLMQSIDENYELVMEPEIEAAWNIEIQRRIADFDSGKEKGIPADEVFAEMDKLIAGL